MSPRSVRAPDPERLDDALALVVADLARQLRDERRRRGWTLADAAARSGLSRASVHAIEHGSRASLAAYVALATAYRLELAFELRRASARRSVDPRAIARQQDPVHAAMGELEARHLLGLGLPVAVDEPYQHYQFAGRADLVAWRLAPPALLHIENRTAFPDLGQVAGAWNAKRRYLGADMARRLGITGFRAETHVMACLWSSEVLHALRMHPATFRALAHDTTAAFDGWWDGRPPERGRTSALILLDPFAQGRRRSFADLETALQRARPRVRGYAEAVARLAGRRAVPVASRG